MSSQDPETLTHLLGSLEGAGNGDTVSVQDLLDQIGDRSIMPVVLAICVLLVSPLSGIPGLPTLSSLVMLTLTSQAVIGRKHLWLPGVLRERRLRSDRLHKAVEWVRKPCAWIDRHSHPRLQLLTTGPLRGLTLVLCLIVPLIWPFLELLPMVTSIGAAAVGMMAFGLLTRDGLYVVIGYGMVGTMAGLIVWMV